MCCQFDNRCRDFGTILCVCTLNISLQCVHNLTRVVVDTSNMLNVDKSCLRSWMESSDQEEDAMWVRAIFSTAILLSWAHLAIAQDEPDCCDSDEAAFHASEWEARPARQKEALREFLENRVAEALRLQHGTEARSVNLDASEQSPFRRELRMAPGAGARSPLGKRLPNTLTISHIEMGIETFHMSEPDEVIFLEDWGRMEYCSKAVWFAI